MVISQEGLRLAEEVRQATVDVHASRMVAMQRQKWWATEVFPREVTLKLRCAPNISGGSRSSRQTSTNWRCSSPMGGGRAAKVGVIAREEAEEG